jgi:hypothetical protein
MPTTGIHRLSAPSHSNSAPSSVSSRNFSSTVEKAMRGSASNCEGDCGKPDGPPSMGLWAFSMPQYWVQNAREREFGISRGGRGSFPPPQDQKSPAFCDHRWESPRLRVQLTFGNANESSKSHVGQSSPKLTRVSCRHFKMHHRK